MVLYAMQGDRVPAARLPWHRRQRPHCMVVEALGTCLACICTFLFSSRSGFSQSIMEKVSSAYRECLYFFIDIYIVICFEKILMQ
jgi:hypothetical protein